MNERPTKSQMIFHRAMLASISAGAFILGTLIGADTVAILANDEKE
jgi:arginine repressor